MSISVCNIKNSSKTVLTVSMGLGGKNIDYLSVKRAFFMALVKNAVDANAPDRGYPMIEQIPFDSGESCLRITTQNKTIDVADSLKQASSEIAKLFTTIKETAKAIVAANQIAEFVTAYQNNIRYRDLRRQVVYQRITEGHMLVLPTMETLQDVNNEDYMSYVNAVLSMDNCRVCVFCDASEENKPTDWVQGIVDDNLLNVLNIGDALAGNKIAVIKADEEIIFVDDEQYPNIIDYSTPVLFCTMVRPLDNSSVDLPTLAYVAGEYLRKLIGGHLAANCYSNIIQGFGAELTIKVSIGSNKRFYYSALNLNKIRYLLSRQVRGDILEQIKQDLQTLLDDDDEVATLMSDIAQQNGMTDVGDMYCKTVKGHIDVISTNDIYSFLQGFLYEESVRTVYSYAGRMFGDTEARKNIHQQIIQDVLGL